MKSETPSPRTCFVIMPIADTEGYEVGHFKRVYDYLIKPAIIHAGFIPIRADEAQKTNFIIIDILKQIITADMAICDLSSRNPNVMYELGIRQAFNLPVTLIKDTKTLRIFDIQGLRDIEYDERLRVDMIKPLIEEISATLTNTHSKTNTDLNSVVQLLGIAPAKITKETELSDETSILLDAIKSINERLSSIEMQKRYDDSPYELIKNHISIHAYKVGDIIHDPIWGRGTILDINDANKLKVAFAGAGVKTIKKSNFYDSDTSSA